MLQRVSCFLAEKGPIVVAIYWILLFLASASLDVLNTNWTKAVVNEKAFRAALCTFIYYIISTTLIVACCSSLWAMAPAALGHAAGTYIAVRWNVCLVRIEAKATPTKTLGEALG